MKSPSQLELSKYFAILLQITLMSPLRSWNLGNCFGANFDCFKQIWIGFEHKYKEDLNTNSKRIWTQIRRGFELKYAIKPRQWDVIFLSQLKQNVKAINWCRVLSCYLKIYIISGSNKYIQKLRYCQMLPNKLMVGVIISL